MKSARIRWIGTRALLIELPALDTVLALHAHLAEHPLPGQLDVLAAAQTVLLKCDCRANALKACDAIQHLDPGPISDTDGKTVDIEVVYDGEDLEAVGEITGLGVDGVISAHTGQLWRAAFGGFAPGFTYLAGQNDALNVPRRDTPRTAVPAGSVALAGNFSSVYPSRSPGGWQLIGRSNARMWDLERRQPALVRPGDSVRYVAVGELGEPSTTAATAADTSEPAGKPGNALEIVAPGIQSLIQDLGRPGFGDLGVSASGAADQAAARQANRLAGNPPGDALIETVLGGLEVRARGDLVLALSGAQTSTQISGPHGSRAARLGAPFILQDGETLLLDTPTAGLRSYLAVRGGIDVPAVLNSRATDTMSGIGPAPLVCGVFLPVGQAGPSHIVGAPEPSTLRSLLPGHPGTEKIGKKCDPTVANTAILRVTLGPRDDWFGSDAIAVLTGQPWMTTQQSNRIGVRLALEDTPGDDGEARPLERIRDGELASEGVVAGALQVPRSGLPVLFLADHPVTGGYPVIAVVVPEDLSTAAQLAPGTGVRFVVVDPDTLKPTSRCTDDNSGLPEGMQP